MLRNLLFFLALAFVVSACKLEETGSKSAPPPAKTTSPEELSAKADIPLYPDAHLPDNKSNLRSDGSETRIELFMVTPDAADKVAAFYVERLKLEKSKDEKGTHLMGRTPKGNYAIITVSREGKDTKIKAVAIAALK
ncbi:MAG: hypothetical protein ACAH95_06295 [Fimbriimonas sp.]